VDADTLFSGRVVAEPGKDAVLAWQEGTASEGLVRTVESGMGT